MKSENDILSKFSHVYAHKISKNTIKTLKKMSSGLSDDILGLNNIWEEICVQMQYDYSYFWDEYEDIVRGLIEENVLNLKDYELAAIWSQSDQGSEWLSPMRIIHVEDVNNCNGEEPDLPILSDDVVSFIMHDYIYKTAIEFSNARIKKFLDTRYND